MPYPNKTTWRSCPLHDAFHPVMGPRITVITVVIKLGFIPAINGPSSINSTRSSFLPLNSVPHMGINIGLISVIGMSHHVLTAAAGLGLIN
jgi:hypothetical protein